MSSKATSPNAATTSTTPTEPPKCPGAVAETGRGRTRRCTSAEPDVAPLAARTSAGSPRLPCSGSHRPPYDCVLTSEDRNAADCRGFVCSVIDVKGTCAQYGRTPARSCRRTHVDLAQSEASLRFPDSDGP